MEKGTPMNEDEINAMITMRIVKFHEALIERGQIKPPQKKIIRPVSDCSPSDDTPQCEPQVDQSPFPVGETR